LKEGREFDFEGGRGRKKGESRKNVENLNSGALQKKTLILYVPCSYSLSLTGESNS